LPEASFTELSTLSELQALQDVVSFYPKLKGEDKNRKLDAIDNF
jgi:hypothetical protein